MRLYVGVTDNDWYDYLSQSRPDEVNFWRPGGKSYFKAIEPNDLFLFRLKSPINCIAGGAFFVRYSILPISLAWEAFGENNGSSDFSSFSRLIYKYKRSDKRTEPDPNIGCIILSSPFFFERDEWIKSPSDWAASIVQGKTYDTAVGDIGINLYNQVVERLQGKYLQKETVIEARSTFVGEETSSSKGAEYLVHSRVGQGTFKVLVTEAYNRRCAITGEKTLPVLEAAHILPYSENGPNVTANGLLLRSDLHTLFDRGYLTITKDLRVEVSGRIKSDYGNGREYYALHGKKVENLPQRSFDRPSIEYIEWHNEHVYVS